MDRVKSNQRNLQGGSCHLGQKEHEEPGFIGPQENNSTCRRGKLTRYLASEGQAATANSNFMSGPLRKPNYKTEGLEPN